MYERIAQNVAQVAVVKVFSSTDHLTPLTGATLTVQISKGGASFASPHSGAVVEIGSGWYSIALDTTDTSTLGPLIVKATATGADTAEVVFDVYNQYNMGIGALPGAAPGLQYGLPTNIVALYKNGVQQTGAFGIPAAVAYAFDPLGNAEQLVTAGNGSGSLSVTFSNTSIGSVSGAVGSVTGAVGSVTAGVTLAASQHVIVDSGSVTTVTGNVNGSVASVTGAVGSVTGAVGSVTAGVTLAASQHVIVDSGSVTTVTGNVQGNVQGSVGSVTGSVGSVTAAVVLPSIPSGWITAAGIAASALNGKGDWATATNLASVAVNAALSASIVVSGAVVLPATPPDGYGGSGGSSYTLAQIAQAVWQDAAPGDFAVAFSGGQLLAGIAAQLGGGSGAVETTITVESTDGVPLPGVAVWITSGGASGSINIVAGPLMSNSSGQVTFMLPAGTWYVWREMSGENFPNPQAITVG